ncbi:MAG: ATP-dependent DNA helicase [Candidatus Woesearchaeota archaeon]
MSDFDLNKINKNNINKNINLNKNINFEDNKEQLKKRLLFPYKNIREEQNKLMLNVENALLYKKNLIIHAPTGLGKTVATLAPSLSYAFKKNLTILFLTSRHTQHKIAIDTLKLIKEKFNLDFSVSSIIGKKWLCLISGSDKMYSSDFINFCKKLREEKKCPFYLNTRKGQSQFTMKASSVIANLSKNPLTTEEVIGYSKIEMMCPYEISLGIAKNAKVIIADYYYLFSPDVSDNFLEKISKEKEKFIVIVDEAHNLPYRLKDLASEYLSSITIKRAIKEAKRFGYETTIEILNDIMSALNNLTESFDLNKKKEHEEKITKEAFLKYFSGKYDYVQMIDDLLYVADSIRELQKQSYIGSIARFLKIWLGQDDGFVRIISIKELDNNETYTQLSYRCLDPSVVSSSIINNTYSTILMSGTLLPTSMYKELLGLENCQELVFKDQFPKKNRLNLIIPKTTTKYEARSQEQFNNIAKTLNELFDIIKGNIAVFFPSYFILNQVFTFLNKNKIFLKEKPNLNKIEKQEMIDEFKSYKEQGSILLAVASGSFGEGIDLPGDFLKAVIIVGLPLNQPDLETKSLIEYFDKKFKKGWDYGYLFPAFNKTLQNAGRCIRTETDKGIIIFLDERYAWQNYKRCFPDDWEIIISNNYKEQIKNFFN